MDLGEFMDKYYEPAVKNISWDVFNEAQKIACDSHDDMLLIAIEKMLDARELYFTGKLPRRY